MSQSAQTSSGAPSILTTELADAAQPLLTRVLSDAGGNVSSIRLAMLLGLLIVLGAWAVVSVQHGVLEPLPDSVFWLLTVLTGAKVGQKFIEPTGSPATTATTASAGLAASGDPAGGGLMPPGQGAL